MNELQISQFREAIRATHGAGSALTGRAEVREFHTEDQIAWEGEVLVFDLHDHPTAHKCYAWSVEGRVTAVLHEGPVNSPTAAVKAAIAAEHRKQ